MTDDVEGWGAMSCRLEIAICDFKFEVPDQEKTPDPFSDPGWQVIRSPRADYNGLICTLRNFTTPAPYCNAIGPLANLSSSISTVLAPFNVTVSRFPLTVMS